MFFFKLNLEFLQVITGVKSTLVAPTNIILIPIKLKIILWDYKPIKNSFHLFFGYRFKAPKQVTKPIEYIEKKVPVLKQNNKNQPKS